MRSILETNVLIRGLLARTSLPVSSGDDFEDDWTVIEIDQDFSPCAHLFAIFFRDHFPGRTVEDVVETASGIDGVKDWSADAKRAWRGNGVAVAVPLRELRWEIVPAFRLALVAVSHAIVVKIEVAADNGAGIVCQIGRHLGDGVLAAFFGGICVDAPECQSRIEVRARHLQQHSPLREIWESERRAGELEHRAGLFEGDEILRARIAVDVERAHATDFGHAASVRQRVGLQRTAHFFEQQEVGLDLITPRGKCVEASLE